MKIREIILTFVVLLHQNLRSEAFDGPNINFTKLEEAKSIKPNQFDEFKNQERILITDIINKIGNPVSLGDIGKFGMCFIYKAGKNSSYLLQVKGISNKIEKRISPDSYDFEVISIMQWSLETQSFEEARVIWKKEETPQKTKK